MLKSYITTEDLVKVEASILDYLRSDEVDYQNQIDVAFEELGEALKNQNKKLRLLCTPLALLDGIKSEEDFVERDRIVININSFEANSRIDLLGTDADDYTFIKSFTPAEEGLLTEKFDKLFRFYKVAKSGNVDYSAELIETGYELPHKYLSLAKIYNSKRNEVGDIWEVKHKEYYDLYAESLLNAMASYDANEDKKIDTKEEVRKNNIVGFRL